MRPNASRGPESGADILDRLERIADKYFSGWFTIKRCGRPPYTWFIEFYDDGGDEVYSGRGETLVEAAQGALKAARVARGSIAAPRWFF